MDPLSSTRAVVCAMCVAVALPAQGQTTLTPAQTFISPGVLTDGLAVGDVHPSAGDEIVVIAEGTTWNTNPPNPGTGRAYVLDSDLNLLTTFQSTEANRELMGIPLIEQLDTGYLEYIVGEFRSGALGGRSYALSGTAVDENAAAWYLAPRAWAGLYNQGASSGDLVGDVGRELVIPSWDGIIQIVQRSNGTVLATADLLVAEGEHLYGHVAVADVINDAGNDLIAVGRDTGRVFALSPDGAGGFITPWYVTPALGSYAFGSGPAIGDIDGDGDPEIVVALTSPGIIRAFDPTDSSGCEYYWNAPTGGDYYWTSPVIGDVDGDGLNEVVAMSNDGQLSILSTDGATGTGCVEGRYEVVHTVGGGGSAWFTPALADVTGDSAVDIITATYTDLEILDAADGSVTVTYAGNEPSASFYPSAAVVERAGGTSVYVSGWANGSVYRFDLSGAPTDEWPTMMGDNERTGFCCPVADGSCDTCGGGSCVEQCSGGTCDCTNPSCGCDLQCTSGNGCSPSCSSGGECDITCSSVNNCTPSCTNGSDCNITCNSLNNCKNAVCSGGSLCDYTCESANNCGLTCDASTCNITCSSINNCKDLVCTNGATCSATCTSANNCRMDCESGSACELQCNSVGTCRFDSCDGVESTCSDGRIVCNRDC
jgi:hypothetical protein